MFNSKTALKKSLLLAAVLLSNSVVFAQGNGAAALSNAATTVRGYGTATQTLVLALGVIIGFVGAIRVYSKWNNGDPDTQKSAIGWFGASLFLVAVGSVLTSFFG
jgi:hypothetical protein